MENKNENFTLKKRARLNDKNLPLFNKEDKMKYSVKNDLFIKKEDKSKNENYQKERKNNKTEEDLEESNVKDSLEEESFEEKDNNKKYNIFDKVKKKIIIILEGATLELGNIKKNPQIINCDEHYKIIKSMKKNLDEFRPDIIHQCLLNLFDSPLNKVGLLQVYIHTNKNILIEINPCTRIPRTFKRFSGLFTQVLLKDEIKASNSEKILIKIVHSRIEDLLEKNTPKVLLSEKGRLVDIETYSKKLINNNYQNLCFIIGTNPKGSIDPFIKYSDDCISISSFELDSNVVCAKICSSFENTFDIL